MRNIPEENRPIRFSDVVGQKVPIKILKAMGKTGNYAPVYVFEGLKGSGKTTDARILARAINCMHRTPDGEPCNECENCKKILAGEAIDIVEIDAASNNSVADARKLVEEAKYRPTELPKKVYILDEAHRMTNEAFDVLLKLLEEPPEWCAFILCTTERAKIRETVLSRSIILTFKAITESEMTERLVAVAQKYGGRLDRAAAEVICRHSGGSMRDALTDLSVCLEEAVEITAEVASDALGVDPVSMTFQLIDALAKNNVSGLITLANHYFDAGRMVDRVLLDAIRVLADVVLRAEGGYVAGTHSPEYETLLSGVDISKEDAIYLAKALTEARRSEVSERSLLAVELFRIAAHIVENYDVVLAELAELKAEVARLKVGGVSARPEEQVVNPVALAQPNACLKIPEATDEEDEEDYASYALSSFQKQAEETFGTAQGESTDADAMMAEAFALFDKENEAAEAAGLKEIAEERSLEASNPAEVPVETEETSGEDVDAGGAGVKDDKEKKESSQDFEDDFFFGLFGEEPAAGGGGTTPEEKMQKSLEEKLVELRKDAKINSFLGRSEIEVYADVVEVRAINHVAAEILKKLLAPYSWIRVVAP